MDLPGDPTTRQGRTELLDFLQTMSATHQATLGRLMAGDGNLAILLQVLEDIGNRYLDLTELLEACLIRDGAIGTH